ncbi:hypothetical protein OIO90_006256 [Microbotryomycetes sp. JL221]|nr:hypothetical protein OIO90_006256 [Microbotryomycetes sp. JL221]
MSEKSFEFDDEDKIGSAATSTTVAARQTQQLERTVTFTGPSGSKLPPRTRTQASRIPIEYRTLSIHVYDSQRFDANESRVKVKRNTGKSWLPWNNKTRSSNDNNGTNELNSGENVDFFSKLDHHLIDADAVCQRFNVGATEGLTASAAAKRLQRNGKNVLQRRNPQLWKKFLRYLFGDFCSILWVGVIIFFISWRPLGNPPAPYNLALAIVVIIVICFQAVFSGLQDWSAARVMDSILNLVPENAVVLRDGQLTTVPSSELVVGDVVQLSTGQKVPADMRIIKASNDLKFDRAVLTGESEEVPGTVTTDERNFLEARNIAFLGTHVCNGTATAVVVLAGSSSVMGRINKLTASSNDERTQLQQEISRFVNIIIGLTLTLVIIMLVYWLAYLRKYHPGYINTVGILTNLMSLVVAFIPEGMPMAVAMTLSLVARRMKDAQVLPKSLSTVETLGTVNVVCSDKTGTLTENRMTVVSLAHVDSCIDLSQLPTNSPAFGTLRRGMVLCNDSSFDPSTAELPIADRKIQGNATDGALLRFAAAINGGLEAVSTLYNRVFDLPFNSKNKFALTFVVESGHKDKLSGEIFVKGAPDVLLDRCSSYMTETGAVMELDKEAKDMLVARQEEWSRLGQRVIMITSKQHSTGKETGTVEFENEITDAATTSLTVIGLVGIVDPPRADIPHTVSEVRRCGSRFFMVTGDFRLTAVAIATQIGILSRRADPDRVAEFGAKNRFAELETVRHDRLAFIDGSLVIEGKEIFELKPAEWDVVCKYEEVVFARTTPEQKLRIVTELRARDFVVAVTGDGVNDAPALKAANVGVALISGSEVAMEAADLVLMGPFSSIVDSIRLGRLVFQNLQKVISYLLPAGSWSEDWPVVLNVFFGCPLPLSSFLMIIICCFTDLACCLMLVFEREEFDLLSLPPRDPKKSHLVNTRLYGHSYIFMGCMETIIAHSMFFLYMYQAAGIPMNKLFFSYTNYSDGYYGHSQEALNNFLNTGQCVYFVALVMIQMFNLNSTRNKKMSILQNGPHRNPWLALGPVISLVIAVFVTEQPGMQKLFGTASVPIRFWLIPVPLGLGLLVMDEIRKLLVRTWPKGPVARVSW